MRARRKKHGAERIAACEKYRLTTPVESLSNIFGNDGRVNIEIGCGKGNFITENAKRYQNENFIAIEKISDVLVMCAEKIAAGELDNVRFLCADAKDLCEIFPEHSVDRIYLNFSDPWPKKGYTKRRLTYSAFLEIYKKILKPNGAIFLKTDNIGLFEFSLEQFELCGFTLKNKTYDLHNSEFAADNIMTEYEKNFSEKGVKINRVEAYL